MTPLKCDELTRKYSDITGPFYNASEVDEAIEELRTENAELKAKLENVQASAYAESVDAGMRERRLKRALWLARANHADTMQKYNIECKCDGWVHRVDKWVDVERKCLKKAKEY